LLLGSCFLSIYVTIIIHLFNYAFYVTRCMDHVFQDAFKWLYKYGTRCTCTLTSILKVSSITHKIQKVSFF
jgi:hypothetical protein